MFFSASYSVIYIWSHINFAPVFFFFFFFIMWATVCHIIVEIHTPFHLPISLLKLQKKKKFSHLSDQVSIP